MSLSGPVCSRDRETPVQLKVTRLVAVSFALIAFALAIASGLAAGIPADAILSRSLVVLIGALVGGWAVGKVCEHLVVVATRRIEARAEAILADEEAEDAQVADRGVGGDAATQRV